MFIRVFFPSYVLSFFLLRLLLFDCFVMMYGIIPVIKPAAVYFGRQARNRNMLTDFIIRGKYLFLYIKIEFEKLLFCTEIAC